VIVIGEFKQGKSSLVNGLVGTSVCPVDDDMATSVLTVVHHHDPLQVLVHRRVEGALQSTRIEPDQLASVVTEHGNPDNELAVERVDVGVPSSFLGQGITLVDSPGAGGLGAGHAAATLAFLPLADAVLFVSDATSELSAPELEFLGQAVARCPIVLVCQTKTDLTGSWRRIVEINRGHLATRGLDLPIVAVSSVLRAAALHDRDAAMNDDSGFPALLGLFQSEILGTARRTAGDRVRVEATDALDQLGAVVDAELEAMRDGVAAARSAEEASLAKARLEALRSDSSRWSQVMSDRLSELSNEVNFEFRESQRLIARYSDEQLEARTGDWVSVVREVQTRLAGSVAEIYDHIGRGAADAAQAVSDLLTEDLQLSVPLAVTPASLDELIEAAPSDPVAKPDMLHSGAASFGRALLALRGMQSGIMLLGLMGTLLPTVALATPIVLGVGTAFGAKSVVDNRKRKVAEARQQARLAIRRLLDDVAFRIGNEISVSLRRVQVQLRDEISSRLTELQRTVAEIALQSATAAQASDADRKARLERATKLAAAIEELRRTSVASAVVPA
jgi:hypothetical protein